MFFGRHGSMVSNSSVGAPSLSRVPAASPPTPLGGAPGLFHVSRRNKTPRRRRSPKLPRRGQQRTRRRRRRSAPARGGPPRSRPCAETSFCARSGIRSCAEINRRFGCLDSTPVQDLELSTESAPAREPSDQASRDRAGCRRGYAKVRPEAGLEADRYGRGYRPRQPSRKGVKNKMMLRI